MNFPMNRLFRPLALMVLTVFGVQAALMAQPGTDEQLAAEYLRQGQYDKAVLYLEKLYDRQPSNLYYEQLLKAYIGLKEFGQAEKLAKERMRKQGGDPQYLVDLGMVLKLQGDTTKAGQQFSKAIKELRPDQGAIRNLANAFSRNNELDLALETYEKGRKMLKGGTDFFYETANLRAAKGDAFDILLVGLTDLGAGDLGEAPVDLDPHVGADNAWPVCVHGDAVARIFLSGRLSQRPHGELARRIGAEHGKAVMAGDRRRRDDFALLSALLELLSGRLDAPEHAADIDLHDLVEFVLGHVRDRLHLGDAGIVHHDVEPAQDLLGVFDGGIDIVAFGHIGFERRRLAAKVAHLAGDVGHLGLVHIDDGDVGAVFGEAQRDRAANALACAGHQGDFTFKLLHHGLSFIGLRRSARHGRRECAPNRRALRPH